LAAADDNDRQADFWVGSSKQNAYIPYYTGFIGQWGHDGHTQGYLKDATVAYVGTHRHSTNDDEPYEYTYMFLVRLDIPKGAKTLTLPNDPHIVIFAATLADDEAGVVPAHQLFETSHPSTLNRWKGFAIPTLSTINHQPSEVEHLLLKANIIAKSGEVNEWEQATNLIDGRTDTKWCDNGPAPHHVVFDLHQPTTISHWHMVNAAVESSAYITRTCLLQGRLSENDEWQTIDMIDGNRYNIVDRTFEPVTVRFLRLFVVGPTQENGGATRIYELNIY
jgi:alpha-mannosidase